MTIKNYFTVKVKIIYEKRVIFKLSLLLFIIFHLKILITVMLQCCEKNCYFEVYCHKIFNSFINCIHPILMGINLICFSLILVAAWSTFQEEEILSVLTLIVSFVLEFKKKIKNSNNSDEFGGCLSNFCEFGLIL